ncbi:MAG: LPP20 family lipoprotein [Spirochaetaceae bacterium]|jgi:hypothetical protein|nr:LPP20 family lipoprotein [Spirochaetaceae bacterium]
MKKALFLLFIIGIFVISCVSEPEDQQNIQAQSNGDAPDWISQIPGDSGDYYIGISGSNTGDQAADQEAAYNKALNSLASAIFTEISSSSEISESESTQDGVSFSYQSNISTSVDQNLQDVETADSYYSSQTGYWYYLRLSRARWDELVNQRAEELKEVVEDLFFDIFRDSLTELKTINRAMTSFEQAYSGVPIKMELLGQRGSVDTILTLRAEKLLGEMTMQWNALPVNFQQGQTLVIAGKVNLSGQNGNSASYDNPGTLTLVLKDQDNRILTEITTQPDGTFSHEIQENQKTGAMTYTLSLKNPFTQDILDQQLNYRYASATQQADVTAKLIAFELESNWESYGLYESVFTGLDNLSPIDLSTEAAGNPIKLRADLSFRLAPPNDWDMIFSYVRCFISLVGPQGEQLLWESPEIKEAGLNEDQANQRAVDKLLETLASNTELQQILGESL